MFVDHVTIAVTNLAEVQAGLSTAGIETVYGGIHSNGVTHMALAGFGDGSYLEVMSTVRIEDRVWLWDDYSLPPQGGVAWTVATESVGAELARAKALGIGGDGPLVIRREKPDGRIGSWELGYLESRQPGGTLPFLIHDVSERSIRVTPSPGVGQSLRGWSAILLAVHCQEEAAAQLQRLYGWGPRVVVNGLSYFPGTPVYLCSPPAHLAEFGESPCAGVLRPVDSKSGDHLRYSNTSSLADKSVRWLDFSLKHFRIGVEILL